MDRSRFEHQLLQALDEDHTSDRDTEWWWDPRPTNGLRLTDIGFQVCVAVARLPHWQFDVQDSVLTPKNLLALDRFMTCPYYLRKQRRQHSLILFGDQESMMASLYGDVQKFIDNLES